MGNAAQMTGSAAVEVHDVSKEMELDLLKQYSQVERIFAGRISKTSGDDIIPEYLVKWQGLSYAEATWERDTDIIFAQNAIDEYKALGKDKGGRMRGLSGCLSRTLLKKANPLVEKNKSLEAEKSIMTNEVMDLKENYKHVTQVIAELKETIVANKQGGITLSTRKPFSPLAECDNIVGKRCILYGWARRLIAHGLIQSVDPNLVVHGNAAGSGNLKIALTEVVDPTCQLWLSDDFHDNIGEVGVGGFVVWPEHSVEVMND